MYMEHIQRRIQKCFKGTTRVLKRQGEKGGGSDGKFVNMYKHKHTCYKIKQMYNLFNCFFLVFLVFLFLPFFITFFLLLIFEIKRRACNPHKPLNPPMCTCIWSIVFSLRKHECVAMEFVDEFYCYLQLFLKLRKINVQIINYLHFKF